MRARVRFLEALGEEEEGCLNLLSEKGSGEEEGRPNLVSQSCAETRGVLPCRLSVSNLGHVCTDAVAPRNGESWMHGKMGKTVGASFGSVPRHVAADAKEYMGVVSCRVQRLGKRTKRGCPRWSMERDVCCPCHYRLLPALVPALYRRCARPKATGRSVAIVGPWRPAVVISCFFLVAAVLLA